VSARWLAAVGAATTWLMGCGQAVTGTTKPVYVFIGDSLTRGGDWQTLFPKATCLNMGITGETSLQIIGRMQTAILAKPDVVFILMGTNDAYYGRTDTMANYDAVLRMWQSMSPRTRVVIQSLIPEPVDLYSPSLIQDINHKLPALAIKYGATFVDLNPLFTNAYGTGIPILYRDGIHPSGAGYEVWARALRGIL
jgi:lysophospholipase L1-like esterase